MATTAGRIACPVCGALEYEQVFPVYTGPMLAGDFSPVEDGTLDNRCCRKCGLVFQAQGIRKYSSEFYRSFKPKAMMKVFTEKTPLDRSDMAVKMLSDHLPMQAGGRLLEVGAGRGLFLRALTKAYPAWDLTAVEPSGAVGELRGNAPTARVFQCDLEVAPIEQGAFDVVAILGVLEHVRDPLTVLRLAVRAMKPRGHLLVEVPNFEFHPNDVYVPDHLTHFTRPTLTNQAAAAGCRPVKVHQAGVPVFALFTPDEAGPRPLGNDFDTNIAVARKHAAYAKACVDAVRRARDAAQAAKETFAIFGVGAAGYMAPFLLRFDPKEIDSFVDQNPNLYDRRLLDRPIVPPETIPQRGIRHVAISASPVYVEKMRAVLARYPVKVYDALAAATETGHAAQ